MPTQELRLRCTPPELLATRRWRRAFLFDGGSTASWGSGFALFGHAPRATLRVAPSGVAVWEDDRGRQLLLHDPIALLERFRHEQGLRQIDEPQGPFAGGLVAVLGYDLKQWIERLPSTNPDDLDLPVLECGWYDWALLFDYRTRTWRLSSAFLSADGLSRIARELLAAGQRTPELVPPVPRPITANFQRVDYLNTVRRALDYILAGDIYQVNLAQRFSASWPAGPVTPAVSLFVHLQRQHPMPFAAFLDCDEFTVVSNSPECFLLLDDETIATFPIKGTRPRGADNASDVASAESLRTDVKEIAEHVMIVDLERNDLGRLCEPGSVTVGSFAAVQSYPTLHHLVSEVSGRLRRGTSLGDILRAAFPGGSITGAPKIRAMEIIDELEPVQRGIYTGSLGFVDPAGRGVFNIAIRTAIARKEKLTYHAGGAIVADSDPDREYDETLLKARAFLDACGVRGPA